MNTIRYICAGHEYRYNTTTGKVTNNYGTVVSLLALCKLTGQAVLYRADIPMMVIATLFEGDKADDAARARFAIGETAAAIPAA